MGLLDLSTAIIYKREKNKRSRRKGRCLFFSWRRHCVVSFIGRQLVRLPPPPPPDGNEKKEKKNRRPRGFTATPFAESATRRSFHIRCWFWCASIFFDAEWVAEQQSHHTTDPIRYSPRTMFSLPIAASIVLLLVHLEKEQVAGLVVPAGRDLLLPFLFISSPFDCSTLLGKNHSLTPPQLVSYCRADTGNWLGALPALAGITLSECCRKNHQKRNQQKGGHLFAGKPSLADYKLMAAHFPDLTFVVRWPVPYMTNRFCWWCLSKCPFWNDCRSTDIRQRDWERHGARRSWSDSFLRHLQSRQLQGKNTCQCIWRYASWLIRASSNSNTQVGCWPAAFDVW